MRVCLVLVSNDERTYEHSLRLAKEHIDPDRLFENKGIVPYRREVEVFYRELDYGGMDYVVSVDADVLIRENLRPYLESMNTIFMDCTGHDKFRPGVLPAGVHVYRGDLMDAARVLDPAKLDQRRLVLKPQSTYARAAIHKILGKGVDFRKYERQFAIFHDWFQYHRDIFAKYVMRTWRESRQSMDAIRKSWDPEDPDHVTANMAYEYARKHRFSRREMAELPRVAEVTIPLEYEKPPLNTLPDLPEIS